MQSSLYVGLSAQLTLQRRLETVAHNVANASTAGFRAEEVKFESYVSRNTLEPVAFPTAGVQTLSRKQGGLTQTGNPFDLAVRGEAWFAIQTATGTVYTRDGRVKMLTTGDLQTLEGNPILDIGGAPIQLAPNNGPPEIAPDGTITQGGRQVGAVGLFLIDPDAKLTRAENSGVVPNKPAAPALDFSATGVVQGFVEQANVNPIAEMSRMIYVQRAFDAVTATLASSEATFQEAIRTLGAPSV